MAKGFWGISWANSADPSDVVAPDGTKQNNGWESGEKPPNHSFNWFWQRICNAFKVLNDQGVMEWDSTTSYPADAVVWHGGVLFVSNAGSNANHEPSTSSTFWQVLREPNVVIGNSAPTNGRTGKLWINTAGGVNRLFGYVSGAWVPVIQANNVQQATATGSANALVANFAPTFTTNAEIVFAMVVAAYANTSSGVTLSCGGGVFWPVVKKNNQALRIGDISGAGHRLVITADVTNSQFVLLNPAEAPATQAEVDAGTISNAAVTPKTLKDGSYCRVAETAYQNYTGSGSGGGVNKQYIFTNPSGVVPKHYEFYARCKVNQSGYVAGDIVPLESGGLQGTSAAVYGYSPKQINAGVDVVLYADTNHGLALHEWASDGFFLLANSSWEIKCVFFY